MRWHQTIANTFLLGFQAIALGWIALPKAALSCTKTFSINILTPPADSMGTATAVDHLPSELFQRWRHSFEDDIEDVTVYRPFDYNFPPARGRAGIEFLAYGGFIDWVIAPTDALQSVHGVWRMREDGDICINFDRNISEPLTIEIIEYSADILKIRRMPVREQSALINLNSDRVSPP